MNLADAPLPETPGRARRLARMVAVAVGVLLVGLAGLLVRLAPDVSPEFRFETDSAYHLRMIESVARTGSFPPADPKYAAAPPRDARRMCPAAYHQLAAAGFAVVRRGAAVSLSGYLMEFGPLLGALPALPLLALVWWLTRRVPETLLAGLLFAVATPVVMRSAFHVVRYEALGITLLLGLAALLVRWRAAGWRRLHPAGLLAACGLLGFLGAGAWRLFPLLAGVLVLGLAAAEALSARTRRAALAPAAAAAAGAQAAAPVWEYYRLAGPPAWGTLLMLPAAVLLYALVLTPPVRRCLAAWPRRRRVALLLGLGVLAVAAGLALPAGRAWLLPSLGLPPGPGAAGSAPVLVSEMLPVPPGKIFSWDFFAYLPLLYLGLLGLLAIRRGNRDADPLAGLLALGGGVLALLFNRLGYFGLPLVIAHFCCLTARLGATRISWPGRRNLLIAPRPLFLLALLPLLAGFALRDRVNLERLARPAADAAAAYRWLSAEAAGRPVVAASWSYGYELQLYTPAATVTDGFLESAENRRRIAGFSAALFAPDGGAALHRYCRRFQARYLLLDSAHLLPLCRRLGLPWREWLQVTETAGGSRVEVLPAGRPIAWIRLLALPGGAEGFRLRFARGNLLIFEVSHDLVQAPADSARPNRNQ